MISVNDFKPGLPLKWTDRLYVVVDFQHVKPGKGAAFVRAKLKNVKTGGWWKRPSAQVKRSPKPTWTVAKCNTSIMIAMVIFLWIMRTMSRLLSALIPSVRA